MVRGKKPVGAINTKRLDADATIGSVCFCFFGSAIADFGAIAAINKDRHIDYA